MDYAYYQSQPQANFHHQAFDSFPTPVSQYTPTLDPLPQQELYRNEYQQFDPSYQFPSNGTFIRTQQQPSPPTNQDPNDSVTHLNESLVEPTTEDQDGIQDGNRSSSEDKDPLTPAQTRRKAQNRAAQRAFRERKEKHVKELESKLENLSQHSNSLLSDNERLKRELQRLATQNEILRATSQVHHLHHQQQQQQQQQQQNQSHSSPSSHSQTNTQPHHPPRPRSPLSGPQTFTPLDFQTAIGEGHHPVSFEDFGGPAGERLLAVGAAWDLIMNTEEFQRGRVDIEDVHRRLKGKTACNGRGPAFREQDVLRAVRESVVVGGEDELL